MFYEDVKKDLKLIVLLYKIGNVKKLSRKCRAKDVKKGMYERKKLSYYG